MTPEEYQAKLDALKSEHDTLFDDMKTEGGSSGDASEEQLAEPEAVAQDAAPEETADVEVDSNPIPEPPSVAPVSGTQGLPDVPAGESQSVDIPEPPAEFPQDIDAFLHEQRSQWLQTQNRNRPKPPDFDQEEDSGMARVGNMRNDLDGFATNMASSYESIQHTFGVLSDITNSHGRNVSDILARLMRQRIP